MSHIVEIQMRKSYLRNRIVWQRCKTVFQPLSLPSQQLIDCRSLVTVKDDTKKHLKSREMVNLVKHIPSECIGSQMDTPLVRWAVPAKKLLRMVLRVGPFDAERNKEGKTKQRPAKSFLEHTNPKYFSSLWVPLIHAPCGKNNSESRITQRRPNRLPCSCLLEAFFRGLPDNIL